MDKNASFGALCATDALGRKLPTHAQVGALRQERVVGMFYFLTHGAYGPDARGPADVTKILKEHPEAIWDFDHPAWCDGAPLYWGEPLFGYYYLDDKWVLRRHIKLLTMAGVDFLVFDTTHRKTFFPQVRGILEVLEEYRREGFRVPQIAYYTNTKSGETVNEIYEDLYKPGLYPELWFRWEGKPFIIGAKEECTPEQQEFFTFRAPQWPTEHKKPLACPWIDFERPQRAWTGPDGENEIVPVSVAQHPNISFGDAAFYGEPSTRGRNFHGCANDKTPEAILYGYNMAEQWERAIALDPKMVFFTGWNEWTAGKIRGDADRPVLMVDQANCEYSRDVEPMRGGFFDNYYMELCDYIRRYKGAPPLPAVQGARAISLEAGFAAWEDVPAYWSMPFGALPRDAMGAGNTRYTESTGRNEFDCVKVAHDENNLYFYARTREDIEFNMFTKWMNLYIGIEGREYAPSWHGYHYLVNNIVLDGCATFLQRSLGGYRWGDNTRVRYHREGREMAIELPKAALGLGAGEFGLYFKWADHTGRNETIEDFYEHGDCAPYGRFAFLYRGQ